MVFLSHMKNYYDCQSKQPRSSIPGLYYYIYKRMVKTQKAGDAKNENKSNKVHKTLRDKLRKKREELKRHKKEKSEQKKQYNPEEEKLKFFSKGEEKEEADKEIKLKRIRKHIEKFINIYEDDLDQFYDMFKTFDEKGFIDISGLENKALYKCLKKLFKYLPLKRQGAEFRKLEGAKVNLQRFMKQKVSQAIENYLQNGSNEQDNDESSADEKEENKKSKKNRKAQAKIEENAYNPDEELRLYKETTTDNNMMGPSIPESERARIAALFDIQLEQMKKQKEEALKNQEDQFSQIFNMGKTRKQLKSVVPESNQPVPEHLMAKGSALIGQKVQIDQDEIEEYNKINRPKKLIEMHKELMHERGEDDSKKRKPFNRERDVLGQGKQGLMTNSTFFDFKSRMSKPQGTNQFL